MLKGKQNRRTAISLGGRRGRNGEQRLPEHNAAAFVAWVNPQASLEDQRGQRHAQLIIPRLCLDLDFSASKACFYYYITINILKIFTIFIAHYKIKGHMCKHYSEKSM